MDPPEGLLDREEEMDEEIDEPREYLADESDGERDYQ